MKNIHSLPTDNPSRIIKSHDNDFILLNTDAPNWFEINLKTTKQNIYITSDEITGFENNIWVILGTRVWLWQNTMALRTDNKPKKIILTTDSDLIKDGVQAIDDEFLEWFVNNPSCEEVEFKKIEDELISPKNPKIRFNALQDPPSFISAESLNNMILTYKYEIIIPQDEPKQEIHVEATEKSCFYNKIYSIVKQIPIKNVESDAMDAPSCAYEIEQLFYKWQAEKSYSENEVELIANEMVNWAIDNIGNPNPQSGKKFDEVLSKFKNKQRL
jgi:hypothetical protein